MRLQRWPRARRVIGGSHWGLGGAAALVAGAANNPCSLQNHAWAVLIDEGGFEPQKSHYLELISMVRVIGGVNEQLVGFDVRGPSFRTGRT